MCQVIVANVYAVNCQANVVTLAKYAAGDECFLLGGGGLCFGNDRNFLIRTILGILVVLDKDLERLT